MRTSVFARLVGSLLAVIVLSSPAGEVAAHTELDFTLPTQDATVGEPVDEITVGFTEAVTLVGPGFEVRDPQGNVVTPFVVTDDDIVFLLQLDPPLAGGEAAVRYEVRSDDGHVVAGGFTFTVSVDAPTTTAAAITTTTATATTTTTTTTTTATTTAGSGTTVATTTGGIETDDAVGESSTPEAAADDAAADAAADSTVTSGDGSTVDTGDDSSGSTAVAISLVVAVVVGAAVFLVIRSRA